jgi:hypothetical protein
MRPRSPSASQWRRPSTSCRSRRIQPACQRTSSGKPRFDIPGSLWLPDMGYGEVAPAMLDYFRRGLDKALGGRTRPLVFYCLRDCWMSWNAAKRALAFCYSDVAWYPDGADGWAAGLPVERRAPETPGRRDKPRARPFARPQANVPARECGQSRLPPCRGRPRHREAPSTPVASAPALAFRSRSANAPGDPSRRLLTVRQKAIGGLGEARQLHQYGGEKRSLA